MVVAYFITHNEGILKGIIENPGKKVALFDLFEVDGTIRAFKDRQDAQDWLDDWQEDYDAGNE
jgi:hypothetical protein